MISFIIPCYNSEKTIKKCLKSIINQRNTDLEFEIIVVDNSDNEKDKTEEIVKSFEEIKEIEYFKIEDSGVSNARNYGMKESKGNYYIFVDSDDYVSNSLLSDIEKYINDDVDIIKWNPILAGSTTTSDRVSSDLDMPHKWEKVITFDKISGEDGFERLYKDDVWFNYIWNFAIKKNIMMDFPKDRIFESFAIIPIIMLKAKSMVAIENYEYYYVMSNNGIMRKNDYDNQKKKMQDLLYNYDYLKNEIDKMNISNKSKHNVMYFANVYLNSIIPSLMEINKMFYIKELKSRKIYRYKKPFSFLSNL